MKVTTAVFLALGTACGAMAQQSAWERNLRAGSEFASQGQFASAERAFLTAISEAEKFGPTDQRLGLSLASLAMLYMKAGQTDKALPLATRALAIRDAATRTAEGPTPGEDRPATRFEQDRRPFNAEPAEAPPAVVINGVALSSDTVRALAMRYGVRPPPGRYWYDRVSGAWGYEGGPMAGQVVPNLAIGGPLRPNASGGGTAVFVNGRELHPMDVAALQRCTPVYPGRYWVNAQGVGGYEGRLPSFNLAALCGQTSSGGRGSSGRTWHNGDGSWSYHNSATGLGAISDGKEIFITGK